jgi:hypothetical protein
VEFTRLDAGLYATGLPVSLRRARFTGVGDPVQLGCGGASRLDQVTVENADYAVQFYNCGAADSVRLSAFAFTDIHEYGVYSQGGGHVALQNGAITNARYGIYQYLGGLLAEDTDFYAGYLENYGVQIQAYSGADSITIRRNTVQCDAMDGGSGITAQDAPILIEDNTATGCYVGIDVANNSVPVGTGITLRGNTVQSGAGSWWGIHSSGHEALHVVGNALSGPAYAGAIVVENGGSEGTSLARIDSNTVTGSSAHAIRVLGADTILIRDNTITNHQGGFCCYAATGAISIESGNAGAHLPAQTRRNRITFSRSNGIVIAQGPADSLVVLVDSNAIRGVDSVGVWVTRYGRATLTGNAIDSSGQDAVRTSNSFLLDTLVIATGNSFTRNREYGFRDLTGFGQRALNNYWGDASGPACVAICPGGLGDSISTTVNYVPFLTAPPAGIPVPAPPVFAAPLAGAGAYAPAVLQAIQPVAAAPPAPVTRAAGLSATERAGRMQEVEREWAERAAAAAARARRLEGRPVPEREAR